MAVFKAKDLGCVQGCSLGSEEIFGYVYREVTVEAVAVSDFQH